MSRARFARSRRARPRSRLRRFADYALAFAILGVFAVIAARLDRVEKAHPAGAPVVNDGDSLTFGTERVRLLGIDAPEYNQTCMRGGKDYACGREARRALAALIGGKPVACEGWEKDRYGRLLATCKAGGVELNRSLVEAGWAVAYGGYSSEERAARAARRGLWAGDFERPRDWRESRGDIADMEHGALASVIHWLRAIFDFS
jgi:endonuclease YncB( thermonuclease family)